MILDFVSLDFISLTRTERLTLQHRTPYCTTLSTQCYTLLPSSSAQSPLTSLTCPPPPFPLSSVSTQNFFWQHATCACRWFCIEADHLPNLLPCFCHESRTADAETMFLHNIQELVAYAMDNKGKDGMLVYNPKWKVMAKKGGGCTVM